MRLATRDGTPTIGVHTSGTGQIQSGSATSGGNINVSSAGDIYSLPRPRVSLAAAADLDRFGSNIRVEQWVANGTTADLRSTTNATVVPPETVLTQIVSLFGRPNGPTFTDPLVGTIHGWLWMHSAPIRAEKLRDALFEAVPTTVDPTGWAPRLLPEDGTVEIDGLPVTPLVFLRGERLDQFEAAPGLWVVPNRGSAGGTLSLLNGAFA
jgi:hypothetical protein